MSTISRRQALGAATAGLGLPLLAACGDDTSGTGAEGRTAGTDTGAGSDPTTSAAPSTSAGGGRTSAAPEGGGLATSDVPVGGGLIEDDVVVTQPTEGEFRAFTAICTHQQCLVGEVADGAITCLCHGSQFSIEDGSVLVGPAATPLAAVDVEVRGDRIVLG